MRLSRNRALLFAAGTTTMGIGGGIAGYTQGGLWSGVGGLLGAMIGAGGSWFWSRQHALDSADAVVRAALTPLPSATAGRNPLPSNLLSPDDMAARRGILLWGRKRQVALLQRWLQGPQPVSTMFLTGPASIGKSRLALELCLRAAPEWIAGRLNVARSDGLVEALAVLEAPVLVVVDLPRWTTELTAVLESLRQASGAQLRLLVVSRNAGIESLMRSELSATSPWLEHTLRMELRTFGEEEDHRRWLNTAEEYFAQALDLSASTVGMRLPVSARRDAASFTIGELLGQALLRVSGSGPTGDADSLEYARALAMTERVYWPKQEHLDPILASRVTAVLLLLEPTSEQDAVAILRRLPELGDATSERLFTLARWAQSTYLGPAGTIVRPQNHLLSLGLTLPVLESDGLWRQAIDPSSEVDRARVAAFLIGTVGIYPLAIQRLQSILPQSVHSITHEYLLSLQGYANEERIDRFLAELVSHQHWSAEELKRALAEFNPSTTPHTYIAVRERIVKEFSAFETFENTVTYAHHMLGVAYSRIGDYERALEHDRIFIERLDQQLREEVNPKASSLRAGALLNMGLALSKLGRVTEAIEFDTRAIDLARLAFEEDSGTTLSRGLLVQALEGYASNIDTYDHAEALSACEEAVAIARDLDMADPENLQRLARVVQGLAQTAYRCGRVEEAIEHSDEAIALFRRLADSAATNSTTARLASALRVRAGWLKDSGRAEEALAFCEEAVGLVRPLVAVSMLPHGGTLAETLETLAFCLVASGRSQLADKAIDEALAVYGDLATLLPETFARAYAEATMNRFVISARTGSDGFAFAKRGLAMYRRLAQTDPLRYRGDLAHALTNVAAAYWLRASPAEAIDLADEAVRVSRECVFNQPVLEGHRLGRALWTRALFASYSGDLAAATSLLLESVHAYEAMGDALGVHQQGLERSRVELSELSEQ